MKARRRRYELIRALVLCLALIAFLLPLLWTLLASLGVIPDDAQTPPAWAWPPTVGNYLDIGATSPDFLRALGGSIAVSAIATLLTMVVSYLATFALARSRGQGVGMWVQSFLILASLPVMAYVLPLSDFFRRLGLYDTFIGVALADTAVFAPLAVYVLFGYLRRVSIDLEESARLEGAGVLRIIWDIALPMSASGVAATAIIIFVLNWNLLLVPLVVTANHVLTIPLLMSDFFILEREIEWPAAAAALIISLIPLGVLVALTHRVLARFALTPAQEA